MGWTKRHPGIPTRQTCVDKKTPPGKGRGVFHQMLGSECHHHAGAQCVFSGNGPNLYAGLDVAKTHHRMTGIVTSSSKGCHELLQRDNIYTQYLALSIELAMHPCAFFYRDLQSVYN